MIVRLDDIPKQGLDVVLGPWAVGACAAGLEGVAAACSGELQLSRHDRHILVRGSVRGEADVRCDRCGEGLRLVREVEVCCLYSPLDAIPERQEEDEAPPLPAGLPVTSCELGEYDGVQLHLGDVVRETFLLERPPRVLCADVLGPDADPLCLARWQRRAAIAPADEVDPRFAALKSFRPES